MLNCTTVLVTIFFGGERQYVPFQLRGLREPQHSGCRLSVCGYLTLLLNDATVRIVHLLPVSGPVGVVYIDGVDVARRLIAEYPQCRLGANHVGQEG